MKPTKQTEVKKVTKPTQQTLTEDQQQKLRKYIRSIVMKEITEAGEPEVVDDKVNDTFDAKLKAHLTKNKVNSVDKGRVINIINKLIAKAIASGFDVNDEKKTIKFMDKYLK